MEDFIDIILVILLILIILFVALIIFLFNKNPTIASMLLFAFIVFLVIGIGIWGWRLYRKKRMGSYYEIAAAILRSRKEIVHSTKKLDRHLKKIIQIQIPEFNGSIRTC